MFTPIEFDWTRLKRLAQYLKRVPRLVVKCCYQKSVSSITAWTDADWAGSGSDGSRMSTSGGLLMLGSHVVKHWSATQHTYALSSGESEYYALVKASSVAIGLQSMLSDVNISASIEVRADASAAIGIASRRGLGRVRHIEVAQLWIQEKVANGMLKLVKVPGQSNLADALTKHVTADILAYHCEHTMQHARSERHKLMPNVIA